MQDKLSEKLASVDGVLNVYVVPSDFDFDSVDSLGHPEITKILQGSIELGRTCSEETATIILNERGSGKKIVVCCWPRFHAAVEVLQGHPVNKSLRRILRKAGVRYAGAEVLSPPPRPTRSTTSCDTEPPAASSSAPTTEPSSPSPAEETPATGGSQEAR